MNKANYVPPTVNNSGVSKQLSAVFFMKVELIPELNINDDIKSKKLLVIAPDGVQIGILDLKKALIVAEELD